MNWSRFINLGISGEGSLRADFGLWNNFNRWRHNDWLVVMESDFLDNLFLLLDRSDTHRQVGAFFKTFADHELNLSGSSFEV